MPSWHGENVLSSLLVVLDGRCRDRALIDMVAFLSFKREFEKDACGTAGKHSCVAMAEIGERLLVVPDTLLNTSSNEKIPDNKKSDTNNKDQVVVIIHAV